MATRLRHTRKSHEPVPRDQFDVAAIAACDAFTALVARIPNGVKVLGDYGMARYARIRQHLSAPTSADWTRLAVLGGQREGVALFLQSEAERLAATLTGPGLPEAEADLARVIRACSEAVASAIEAERDPALVPVAIERTLTASEELARYGRSGFRRQVLTIHHRGFGRRRGDVQRPSGPRTAA